MAIKGKAACWMEEREVSMQEHEVIPGGWKSQHKKSLSSKMTLTLFNTPWGKTKIPGEWICQREANNTNCDQDPLKGTIRET